MQRYFHVYINYSCNIIENQFWVLKKIQYCIAVTIRKKKKKTIKVTTVHITRDFQYISLGKN